MTNNEFTIEVKTKISIDRSTAEACLKFVEMYMNEHSVYIKETIGADGILLEFKDREQNKVF